MDLDFTFQKEKIVLASGHRQTSPTCLARVSEYTGRWYEYASTPTDYSQGNDNSCVRALYTDQGDGSIGVFNEAVQ